MSGLAICNFSYHPLSSRLFTVFVLTTAGDLYHADETALGGDRPSLPLVFIGMNSLVHLLLHEE